MWKRAARQISSRRSNFTEQSIIPCHVCGSRRSNYIYTSLPYYEKSEPTEFNRILNLNVTRSGTRQGCFVPGPIEDSVSTLDATLNSVVHLPWFANQLRRMLPPETGRDRFGVTGGISPVDPPWPPRVKAFASTAEAVVSSDVDEEVSTSEEYNSHVEGRHRPLGVDPNNREATLGSEDESGSQDTERMEKNKYRSLRRRQMKTETEAWQQAAKEYRELMTDMCQQKLAPNLPYMKSLFLGWFEPLRDIIASEQISQDKRKFKTSYGDYLAQLPPDMLAVITMHKLMGLLMTGQDGGCARVVQAAVQIGEAVEHEVGKHRVSFSDGQGIQTCSLSDKAPLGSELV